ncbi:MAG TPA: diguanylate cyclase, partial [Gammaproteobacteria bacterium]|nr:diguanylate cyclase [Gammaproteobacteria bacterium]
MKLRSKVLLILAGMWAIISLSIFIYSKSTLINDYLAQENKSIIKDVNQTEKTLSSMMSGVDTLNRDWSSWDDAYHFMENKNEAFVKSNLTITSLASIKVNLILFFDTTGKLFYGLDYDSSKKIFVPIQQDLLTSLEANKSLIIHTDINSNKMGIMKLGNGYVVLSSLPILTSHGKGPSHGTIVMGYFFTNEQLKELSEIVNMQVGFFPLPLHTNDKLLQTAYTALMQGSRYYIAALNENTITGYTLIKDINHNPLAILSVTTPRILYQQGIKTINGYLAIVISIGIIFIASIWYLLKIFVLDRVINVSSQVVKIHSESNFSNRLTITGKDELEDMVHAMNDLMEIIELTQEQLRHRIYLRTEELERISKLNKNLYSEIKSQRETESKMREEEKVLKQLAYYDLLTGLPNRLLFSEILRNILAKSERDNSGLVILFIDADKFKDINDTFGHDVGDQFLIHTAQQLKASLTDSDIAARIAGDEFIVCLSNIKEKPLINNVVDKILHNLSLPLPSNGFNVSSTFSIGIAIYP